MACTTVPWKRVIVNRLRRRDVNEKLTFVPVFDHMAKLADLCGFAKSQSAQFQADVERLRKENLQLQVKLEGVVGSQGLTPEAMEKMQADRNKLYTLQTELTDVLREKSTLTHQTLQLSTQLQEKQKVLDEKEAKIRDLESQVTASEAEKKKLRERIAELHRTSQRVKDEFQASQLALESIEEKYLKLQAEHNDLIEKCLQEKTAAANLLNAQNDAFFEKAAEKQRKVVLNAVSADTVVVDLPLDASSKNTTGAVAVVVPQRAHVEFDCHEGECDAVRWGPSSNIFATGGWDRKLNIWSFSSGDAKPLLQNTLYGCNAGIMGIDFDPEEKLIAVASNDFASRLWNLSTQRIVHTLTGHTNKVMAARFCGQSTLVTGSHDRTLKIWDLNNRVCSKTIFAGSSCNDLVTVEMLNSLIISGHFDKRLRFWDKRADTPMTEILLQNRITSVDVDCDRTQILVLSRDDVLTLIDLRNNKVLQTFSADNFRVAYDWSRAVFSPDGQYVCSGSTDGNLYVWDKQTAKVIANLRGHQSAIVAVAWQPSGRYVVSVDKQRRAIIWSD